MQVDVCLEMVFTQWPVEKRIAAITKTGFKLVEFWFHDATFDGADCNRKLAKNAAEIRRACRAAGVKVNNLVVNAPDGSIGGAPVKAADLSRYLERVEEVIDYADKIGCCRAITCSGNVQPGLDRPAMRRNLEKALARAAGIAACRNFTLFLEPLNTAVNHPGYYLDSSAEAAAIVRAINSPHLRLLFDIYHMQIMEGNIIAHVEANLDIIGHFHLAGVPGRNEITGGELNYGEVLRRINAAGYTGVFGLEYAPAAKDHAASLKQTRAYLDKIK